MLTKQLNRSDICKALIIIVLLILHQKPYAQETISLDEAIQRALEGNPYANNKATIDKIYKLQMSTTNVAYLPQADVVGRASWQSDVTSLPIELPSFDIPTVAKDQYKLALDINQLLYDGGKIKAIKNEVKITNEGLLAQEEIKEYHLQNEVTKWYYNIVMLERLIGQTDLILKEINQNRQKVQSAIDNGVAIKQDLLKLKAREIEVSQRKNDLMTKRSSAIAALGVWINEDPTTLESKTFLIPNIDESTNLMESIRPELELYRLQREATIAKEGILSTENKPVLALNINGGYGRPGLNFLSTDFDVFATAGLNLKIPLTDYYAGKSSKQKEILSLKRNQIDEEERVFINQISAQDQAAQIKIENIKALIVLDQQNVAIKEEILAVAKAQWENGVITTTDYLQEMTQSDIAKQNQIVNEVNLGEAISEYKFITGNL